MLTANVSGDQSRSEEQSNARTEAQVLLATPARRGRGQRSESTARAAVRMAVKVISVTRLVTMAQ